MSKLDFLSELGIEDVNLGGFSTEWLGSGNDLESIAPADGSRIASIQQCNSGDYEKIISLLPNNYNKEIFVITDTKNKILRYLRTVRYCMQLHISFYIIF